MHSKTSHIFVTGSRTRAVGGEKEETGHVLFCQVLLGRNSNNHMRIKGSTEGERHVVKTGWG